MKSDAGTFELRDCQGVPVILATGEIDLSNVDGLNDAFEKSLSGGRRPRAIILSLEHVSYLDSTSFMALGRWSRQTQILVVRPSSESVQKLFAIVGLQRVVQLFDTLSAALASAEV